MTFAEISYTPQQKEFLAYLDEIGAVLETVIIAPQETVLDVYETLRASTAAAMDILAIRHEQQFQRINLTLNIKDYYNIEIIEGKDVTGKTIGFNNFVGPGYDIVKEKLNLYTYSNDNVKASAVNDGFAYALICTPHGLGHSSTPQFKHSRRLQRETDSAIELLKSYFELILSVKGITDTESLQIFSWSTDWSNYFDAGKEWWGEFCWTIYNPDSNTITFIAASSTD